MNRRGFIASLLASPLLKWLPKRRATIRPDQHMAIAFDWEPIYSAETLIALRSQLQFAQFADIGHEREFKIGDTIRVKRPVKYVV